MKTVSIIIPLYNREELVRETLDSVLAQTYPHWECIIVDDVSTDNSLATAKEYAARDNRFKVFQRHREPKGAPTCRNIGLEKAEGELVVFFDSDDLMLPYCLKNRVKYFREDESLDLLVSYQKRMENGKETFYVNVPSEVHPLIRFYTIYPEWDIPWVNNSTTLKKKVINEYKLTWDEEVSIFQDIHFNVAVLSVNPTYKWQNEDFDTYWVSQPNSNNIGSVAYDGLNTEVALFGMYNHIFESLPLRHVLLEDVRKQLNYITHRLVKKGCFAPSEELSQKLLNLLRANSTLDFFSKWLLRINIKLAMRTRRFYIHRFFRERSFEMLKKLYPPVIERPTYLREELIN